MEECFQRHTNVKMHGMVRELVNKSMWVDCSVNVMCIYACVYKYVFMYVHVCLCLCVLPECIHVCDCVCIDYMSVCVHVTTYVFVCEHSDDDTGLSLGRERRMLRGKRIILDELQMASYLVLTTTLQQGAIVPILQEGLINSDQSSLALTTEV